MVDAFVLLHGGGLGSWVWEPVVPVLALPALAIDLPGRNGVSGNVRTLRIADCAQHIVNTVEAAHLQRIVLVAHSYSGVLAAPTVAQLGGRVAHVVFIGASVPQRGQRVLDSMTLEQRRTTALGLQLVAWGIPLPKSLVHRTVRQTVLNDMDEATIRFALDHYVANDVLAMFRERTPETSLGSVPRTYIKLLRDQGALPPPYQDRIIASIQPVDVLTLDTGHTAMLSRPRELAALFNQIAASIN